jgi:DNA-binding NarL/FixJ family response regulator
MIRILLVEDHVIVRDGLKMLLQNQLDMKVVAEASNGIEAKSLLAEMEVDLAILDINMEEMDGIETAEFIKENYKDVKIMMLSMLDNENFVNKSFQAGATGYILKNVKSEEFINAIKEVASGNPYVSHKISASMVNRMTVLEMSEAKADIDLSKREKEILNYIAEGFTNGEIADKTFTSKRTVETHRKNLIEKTGTKNTASLVKFAILNGILK